MMYNKYDIKFKGDVFMNCPNCGRPLAEGEVCNCVANEIPQAAPAPAPEPQPQQVPPAAPQQNAYYAPPVAPQPPQSQTYFDPSAQPPVTPAEEIPARTDYPEGYKIKKKYIAVLLALTLGPLGIHNYYLGNNNKGLTQLLICLIGSLFAGLGFMVSYIWAFVEAVMIFTEKEDKDANGYKIMTFEECISNAIEKKEASKEE